MLHNNRKQWKVFSFFLFLSLFFSFWLSSYGFSKEDSDSGLPFISSEAISSSKQETLLEKIDLLALYTVEKGKTHSLFFTKEDLRAGRELAIKGYISGVVLLSKEEIEADIGDKQMSRIRENEDGTLVCRHFGPIPSMKTIFPYLESVFHKKPTKDEKTGPGASQYLFGAYSYFPEILGAGVSSEDRFFISIKKGNAASLIPIRQQGSRTIFRFQEGTREEITFRYQGASLAEHFSEEGALRKRLVSIAKGIRSVEDRFDMGLVTSVNLVDYAEIRNAVTFEGQNEIWLYMKALREEPMEELQTIAEHETLHLLVDRLGFADDSALREQFADLKGFEILSSERFMLITRGILPSATPGRLKENTLFFEFINERHFLEGMKGGHAHQNPDEFCTSFIHSLMFVERLGNNLDRPLGLGDHQEPYRLTHKDKLNTLKDYMKTLEILERAMAGKTTTFYHGEKFRHFFEEAHLQAKKRIKEAEAMQTAESSKGKIERRSPSL